MLANVADHTPRRRLATEARRAEILASAQEAYAAAPYSAVTVAQIAKDAGASQALLFHYFTNKAGLYTAVVEATLAELRHRQAAAVAALPAGVAARDRVRAMLDVTLDHVADHPASWVSPVDSVDEPEEARAVRTRARAEEVTLLAGVIGVRGWARHTYALWGYLGFVDQACRHWAEEGLSADQREPLIAAALGALEGGLGDWAV